MVESPTGIPREAVNWVPVSGNGPVIVSTIASDTVTTAVIVVGVTVPETFIIDTVPKEMVAAERLITEELEQGPPFVDDFVMFAKVTGPAATEEPPVADAAP